MKMKLEELGYTEFHETYRTAQKLDAFEVGRIITEHKDRYVVKSINKEYDAELVGNLRFSAESRLDLPAVGDWVAISEYDEGKALIHAIYPRQSIIQRKAVGKSGQVQIIATNIDFGLIVQAVDRDFNLNRMERYLTICHASKVKPIIVLTKIDLISEGELELITESVKDRVKDIPCVTVSNQTKGYTELETLIQKGKTYCLLGSSGVGKSTILNNLSGQDSMKTGEISTSVNKGKHVTTHRELILLEDGAILIDNPGMREVGIADTSSGLEITFDKIMEYADSCKYKNCTHLHEQGCAVLQAVEDGDIAEDAYTNFRKMEKEKMHFEADALQKRRKDKMLGKMYKNIQKQNRKNKY